MISRGPQKQDASRAHWTYLFISALIGTIETVYVTAVIDLTKVVKIPHDQRSKVFDLRIPLDGKGKDVPNGLLSRIGSLLQVRRMGIVAAR